MRIAPLVGILKCVIITPFHWKRLSEVLPIPATTSVGIHTVPRESKKPRIPLIIKPSSYSESSPIKTTTSSALIAVMIVIPHPFS